MKTIPISPILLVLFISALFFITNAQSNQTKQAPYQPTNTLSAPNTQNSPNLKDSTNPASQTIPENPENKTDDRKDIEKSNWPKPDQKPNLRGYDKQREFRKYFTEFRKKRFV
ncbi:MAG: hypothetical protein PHE24_02465 [Patescibacteria group bacterium]|nr:hypothetical protein [Patescibacteria group bacterium]